LEGLGYHSTSAQMVGARTSFAFLEVIGDLSLSVQISGDQTSVTCCTDARGWYMSPAVRGLDIEGFWTSITFCTNGMG
jgi:hypothetical protein